MKILLLDIETAPNVAHIWGLWQQNVSTNQLLDSGYVLCWSAKWLNEDPVFFNSVHISSPKAMLKQIYDLLEEADAVVHYNGTKFDIPTLNKEFLLHGMTPPAPYKQIDLLKTARQQFKFPSNKLDYIAKALGLGQKVQHRGHELWIACMNNDPKAWEEMQEYNIHDVVLLERVYQRLKPWIKNHPNQGIYNTKEENDGRICPKCGSSSMRKRGFAFTISGKYQRYKCSDCGGWHRDAKQSSNLGPKPVYRFSNA